MNFKDVVSSKIAKEQRTKQQINRVAIVTKKALDTDVKFKVQKNKPAGLDTSSPQILEGKAKKTFDKIMNANSNVEEAKADFEKFKAKTERLVQKKREKLGLDAKTAELQELVNKSEQIFGKIGNISFQSGDKFGVFKDEIKRVPKKFTDKEIIAKLMDYIDKELGKGRAEQYLQNAKNGLQSQATEKAIKELIVFEPTKQQKTSDTHDEESSIDTLLDTMKDVYTNLRNYYLSMVKVNNVIEDELLPTVGVAASKTNKMNKKALQYWDGKGSKETAEEETNEYDVSVKVVFNGTVYCKATSQDEANSIVVNNFRCLLGKCEDNLEDGSITDWDMNVHGETELDEEYVVASKKQVVTKKAKMHKKAADNRVRIFLTNLGKYNEGELVGEWVTLPVQDFKPILERIGIDGKNYEEVFITDYEAPFDIEEYDNINLLNEKVKKIETLDEEQKDVLYSVMGNWNKEDFDELFKLVEEREYMYVPQGNVNPKFYGTKAVGPLDLAVGYIEQLGGVGTLDEKTIDDYFDYYKYGEYLESMGFETTEKGYVQF